MTRSPNGASPAIQSDRVHEALNPPTQGWRLVPEEPTEEMIAAAVQSLHLPWREIQRMLEAYRAMLSAAPPLEVGEDIISQSQPSADKGPQPCSPDSGALGDQLQALALAADDEAEGRAETWAKGFLRGTAFAYRKAAALTNPQINGEA